jgi:DNA-binding transcriptional MerR regulator
MSDNLQIPDKKYFSISEVSKLCDLKTHTLRFWEKEFKELTPVTRKGGRRSYQRKDVLLINKIKALLQDDGLTIAGAKKNMLTQSTYSIPTDFVTKEVLDDLEKILEDLN